MSKGTPKGFGRGLGRNEKVAHEGASIWILLSEEERRSWINVAVSGAPHTLIENSFDLYFLSLR